MIPKGTPTPTPTATIFDPWVGRGLQSLVVDAEADSKVELGVEENAGVVAVVVLVVRVALTELDADVEEVKLAI